MIKHILGDLSFVTAAVLIALNDGMPNAAIGQAPAVTPLSVTLGSGPYLFETAEHPQVRVD